MICCNSKSFWPGSLQDSSCVSLVWLKWSNEIQPWSELNTAIKKGKAEGRILQGIPACPFSPRWHLRFLGSELGWILIGVEGVTKQFTNFSLSPTQIRTVFWASLEMWVGALLAVLYENRGPQVVLSSYLWLPIEWQCLGPGVMDLLLCHYVC